MKFFFFSLFVMTMVISAGCKSEAKGDQNASAPQEQPATSGSADAQATTGSSGSQDANTQNGSSAAGDAQGHDYTFLTHQLFRITGAYVPGKDPKEKPFDGDWVDLDPDGTYKYGNHQKQTYTGTWSYNHSVTTLSLHPNDKSVAPTEWKVMFNDQMMVWVAAGSGSNQGTQLRLVRNETRPD